MFLHKKELIEPLSKRLLQQLPGQKAHEITKVLTDKTVNFPNTPQTAVPASVLILLFPEGRDIHFFLTKRSNEVEHHKGQISLPGGAWEDGEQLYETALRETEEEIGVAPKYVQILGGLTPFFTPVTGFMIHPYIGWSDKKPNTQIQDVEVETLFTATLNELTAENTFQSEKWVIRGYDATVPFFNFMGILVLGVTAAILSELKIVIKECY